MSEIHVSGCQFATWTQVNAQPTPFGVSPRETQGFWATYAPSSRLKNPLQTVWPNTATTANNKQPQTPQTSRRSPMASPGRQSDSQESRCSRFVLPMPLVARDGGFWGKIER